MVREAELPAVVVLANPAAIREKRPQGFGRGVVLSTMVLSDWSEEVGIDVHEASVVDRDCGGGGRCSDGCSRKRRVER